MVPETVHRVSGEVAKTTLTAFLENENLFSASGVLAITSLVSESTGKEYFRVSVDVPDKNKLKNIPETWEGYSVVVRNMRFWRS